MSQPMFLEEPINGTCCACGYSGDEETPCLKREDGAHCEHWWDGDGTECEHGSPACAECLDEYESR